MSVFGGLKRRNQPALKECFAPYPCKICRPMVGSGIELAVVLPAMLAPARLLPVQVRVKAGRGARDPARHV